MKNRLLLKIKCGDAGGDCGFAIVNAQPLLLLRLLFPLLSVVFSQQI